MQPDGGVITEGTTLTMTLIQRSTTAPTVQIFDDETMEPLGIRGAYLGCLVQIGDGHPRLTSNLTDEEREALLLHLAEWDTQLAPERRHSVLQHIEEWTDDQVCQRLRVEPGDVPIVRGTDRLLSMYHFLVIAEYNQLDFLTLVHQTSEAGGS